MTFKFYNIDAFLETFRSSSNIGDIVEDVEETENTPTEFTLTSHIKREMKLWEESNTSH